MTQASFTLQIHNPDVLTCIANLSNDEVFTPPEFANQVLDTLESAWADSNSGENIWENKEVRFLDPCTKSGVFLREIVKRLNTGLAREIPDLTERVNHILTSQIFGIGLTELTSLLARRSVYCSKNANGIHSIARTFSQENGNIWFERTEHSWRADKCIFCSANKGEYARAIDLETHAYAFIHSQDIKTSLLSMFGEEMHFDVIIGNPPYQLSDGGFGISAVPIYHKFVEQAKALEPRYLAMVVPARWFAGGKGLDDFRESMLKDTRISRIMDFPDSNEVFPGTQIKGGVCYFLWERDYKGQVKVSNHDKGRVTSTEVRNLLEPGADVFIRFNEAVSILKKVMKVEVGEVNGIISVDLPIQKQFSTLVSSRKPFGLSTLFKGKTKRNRGDLTVYQNGGIGYTPRKDVMSGLELIDHWKVFIPRAGSGSDSFPHQILGKAFIGSPGTISSETYLCIGPLSSEQEAKNVCIYLESRLLRFLVLLHKPSQDATRSVYTFVPRQDFSKAPSDTELYKKYSISEEEVTFIESLIRPMGSIDE
jgi:site-specific DNA-methyltransferase (adenine-specific)